MGFGGISMWQLIIVLVIILLLFGTKKLRNIGGDLGSAVKGFKKAMTPEDEKNSAEKSESSDSEKQLDAKSQETTTASTSAVNNKENG